MFEEIGVFYRGLVLGLMIAAPVGPIGILCMRRTIQKGIWIGFATGLGAACADTIFAAVAALGVAAILEFMHHYDLYIRIVGGIFLITVAWHTWHDKPKQPKESLHFPGGITASPQPPSGGGLLSAFNALISGYIITMTNPLTLFGTLAVVATFGNLQTRLDASTLVAGIFSGSTLWWLDSGGRCRFGAQPFHREPRDYHQSRDRCRSGGDCGLGHQQRCGGLYSRQRGLSPDLIFLRQPIRIRLFYLILTRKC